MADLLHNLFYNVRHDSESQSAELLEVPVLELGLGAGEQRSDRPRRHAESCRDLGIREALVAKNQTGVMAFRQTAEDRAHRIALLGGHDCLQGEFARPAGVLVRRPRLSVGSTPIGLMELYPRLLATR